LLRRVVAVDAAAVAREDLRVLDVGAVCYRGQRSSSPRPARVPRVPPAQKTTAATPGARKTAAKKTTAKTPSRAKTPAQKTAAKAVAKKAPAKEPNQK
jgi:hypothetical protein